MNVAKRHLIEADSPRPSVLVIFNLEEKGSREKYRNVELYFEIILRDPETPKETKFYERGVGGYGPGGL